MPPFEIDRTISVVPFSWPPWIAVPSKTSKNKKFVLKNFQSIIFPKDDHTKESLKTISTSLLIIEELYLLKIRLKPDTVNTVFFCSSTINTSGGKKKGKNPLKTIGFPYNPARGPDFSTRLAITCEPQFTEHHKLQRRTSREKFFFTHRKSGKWKWCISRSPHTSFFLLFSERCSIWWRMCI